MIYGLIQMQAKHQPKLVAMNNSSFCLVGGQTSNKPKDRWPYAITQGISYGIGPSRAFPMLWSLRIQLKKGSLVHMFWRGSMKSLASSKKASADFSFLSVRLPCVFFANRGSGLRHPFFVSVTLPVTCDGLDPLCKDYSWHCKDLDVITRI